MDIVSAPHSCSLFPLGNVTHKRPLCPWDPGFLIPALPWSRLGSPLCIYLLVQYKLACFVLFIPLFVDTDTRHQVGRSTLLPKAMAHFLRLSSRSFPPPGSPLPTTHVNLGALGVEAPGENSLLLSGLRQIRD